MMEGKISKDGELYIKRGLKLRRIGCPFIVAGSDYLRDGATTKGVFHLGACCDECVHFGEPVESTLPGDTIIEICHDKKLRFSKFKDERPEV